MNGGGFNEYLDESGWTRDQMIAVGGMLILTLSVKASFIALPIIPAK
jgi:hypothetical protein